MKFLVAGNWKMNKTPVQASDYVRNLREAATVQEQQQLVLLPPALCAAAVAETLEGTQLAWGGQNCYSESQGAFTGENSPEVLKSMGATYCLAGHSERRQIFGEPDELIGAKVAKAQALGLTPILCVGETQDDRRWNRTQEVIVRQTRNALKHADPAKSLCLAYEPVWAIGTGVVATPDQVEEAHTILRKALREWSSLTSERVQILYGGSVKAENAASLSVLGNVNGFLVGGASLNPIDLLNILRSSSVSKT
jgi:triosephosphate isomerase